MFEQELIAGGGNDDEGDRQNQREPDPVLANRKDRHVGGVGRLELPGFAVEHVTAPPLSLRAKPDECFAFVLGSNPTWGLRRRLSLDCFQGEREAFVRQSLAMTAEMNRLEGISF